ncbi:PspC domain-containing protein [Streptosporangium sp. NPDC004631]
MSENDFSPVRQLRRTRDGRIIAGVASGLGRYIGIDPNIIRAVLAVASLFGGLGVGIYVIGWLLLPDEGKNRSILQDLVDRNKDNPVWLDTKAKAEQGWAKAEQSWTRATSQRGPQQPAPRYPTHQDPAPRHPAPAAPRNHDDPGHQA